MSLAVMKSPAKQGSTSIASMYYRCEDCGDVSHSLASLSLHRSVCHTSKAQEVDESEAQHLEEVVQDQIAESCECPKCGEHLLLLREHNFNCALCEFQDTDQERFFVHLKKHYELNSVSNVDPGSLIIEQVIDDTTVDAPANNDNSGGEEPDDRDDPEYEPSDSDNDDDESDVVVDGEPTTKKPKLGISWKSSPNKGDSKKKLDFVKSSEDGVNNTKKSVSQKMGITWHTPQEKGAPKKLSFVKTPVTPSKTTTIDSQKWLPLKEKNSQKKKQTPLNFEKKPSAPSKAVSIKKEPGISGAGTKWVRFEDIKYVGLPMEASTSQRSPRSVPSVYRRPNRTKVTSTPKGSSPTKGSTCKTSPATSSDEPGLTETPIEGEPKKKGPRKSRKKEQKIPVCGICKKVFATSQTLKHHLKIHTGEKNYTCDVCGKAFTQWSTCQQHIVSVHSGVKKYTCEYCGACFARSSGLSQHRRMHTGEILHWCSICGKGFRAKSYLDRHRTLHTGEKRYKCEFCAKNFRTSTDMKRHKNSVHFGLGNVSLTVAKELLMNKMEVLRAPQGPSTTVIQRFVAEESSSGDDAEEVVRATEVITGSHYEL